MDFSECMSKADDPKKCSDYREDYLECLHHRKEVRRGAPARWRRRPCPSCLPSTSISCRSPLPQFIKLNTLFKTMAKQANGEAGPAGHGGGH